LKRSSILLVAILLITSPLAAQPVDKAKLRAATTLPSVTSFLKIGSDDLDRREPSGKKIDFARKIAGLNKRLDGSARDADVYLDLAECYRVVKDDDKRTLAGHKAGEVLQPLLDKAGPADGRLLATYCKALWVCEPDEVAKREKWCRQASRIAPAEWRCWAQLGNLGVSKFYAILNGAGDKALRPGTMKTMLADLVALHPSTASVDAAARCLEESSQCYAQVRRLAGHDPEAIFACFGSFDSVEPFLVQTIDVLRGLPPKALLRRDHTWVKDATELADLYPDNMMWQMQGALWEMGFAMAERPVPSPAEASKAPCITPAGRKAVQKYLDRLARGGQNEDAQAAAYCHRGLAYFHMNLEEIDAAVKAGRRALELDPDLPEVWELLGVVAAMQGQKAEAVEIFRSALKRFPTAHNHYLVAKALAKADRLPEAEQELRDALKAFPDDLTCMAGLAAILILRSDKADTLPEAMQLMQTVNYQVQPDKLPSDLVQDLTALTVICEGLTNHEDQARSLLAAMLRRVPETAELRKIREALGP
jgi:tetratricopeptide (TPR) repeat protein